MNDFWYTRSKKDKRSFLFKLCKENAVPNDTMKIVLSKESKQYYAIANYDSFDIWGFYENEKGNLGKNYPSTVEFTNYLKTINSPNYFELLPSQTCVLLK